MVMPMQLPSAWVTSSPPRRQAISPMPTTVVASLGSRLLCIIG